MAATSVIFTDSDDRAKVLPKKLNLAITDLNNAIGAGGTGSGDMLKSVYDTNANGIVDTADAIGWTSVTGKPTTFPPDSTAMLKSVYDTNANNVVDTCDSLAWSKLTGVPATFPPNITIDPGTWTTLSPATGWSAGTVTPQYRIQTIGSAQTVFDLARAPGFGDLLKTAPDLLLYQLEPDWPEVSAIEASAP